MTRIDFENGELGEEYEKSIETVLTTVLESLNTECDDTSDDGEPAGDRLSPQLERMKLKNTIPKPEMDLKPEIPPLTPTKSKKRIPVTTITDTKKE